MPVLFIQAHQHAAIAGLLRIARHTVIRADVNATARHDGSRMGVRPERHAPLHVFPRFEIERIRQTFFIRDHIPRPRPAPLRRIRRVQSRQADHAKNRRNTAAGGKWEIHPPRKATSAVMERAQTVRREDRQRKHRGQRDGTERSEIACRRQPQGQRRRALAIPLV